MRQSYKQRQSGPFLRHRVESLRAVFFYSLRNVTPIADHHDMSAAVAVKKQRRQCVFIAYFWIAFLSC